MNHGINRFVVLVAAIAGLSGFLFGFDSSVIADIHDQVSVQLSLSTWQWSQVVSVSLLGSICGIPLSGLVADRISRRSLLKAVALLFIAGTLICADAHTLTGLLAGRLLIGLCIGVASYAAPLYIAEMAPRNKRGALVLMNGLAITSGQAAAYLLGYFLHDVSSSSWRLLLAIGILPALVLFLGLFFVPHSPRWLLKHHGEEKAREALNRIRPHAIETSLELEEIKKQGCASQVNPLALLKRPLAGLLLLGVSLGIFQQFSGINAILFYGPMIFHDAGFMPVKNAILATFWLSLINFIFTGVTACLIDRHGRRSLLLGGSFLACISLLAASLFFALPNAPSPFVLLLFMTLYVIGYCISLGSLFWVLIAEIYPSGVRGMAMSFATLMQWAANFAVSISFLQAYERVGESTVFLGFSIICLSAFVVTYYFVPETSGVSLEKIEENLTKGFNIRDIGQPLPYRNNPFDFTLEKTP
ncbi:sugar porter family MFS transporter [Legionella taurinensis]|uniref:MFS transporter n=1 Tax=Legionella taurinensis TaxID=70611 RepID=A0A3A5L6H4_9GAMM|nr:sugar porter family MFS transporter [Legionella taurinensis]RJT46225.1 MFS transporter [Legionella taurinensis]RJT67059.1 MFS transporter [Legionella taurinensis]STY26455.1 sugar-proton symporter [Legionella taurinensis]